VDDLGGHMEVYALFQEWEIEYKWASSCEVMNGRFKMVKKIIKRIEKRIVQVAST